MNEHDCEYCYEHPAYHQDVDGKWTCSGCAGESADPMTVQLEGLSYLLRNAVVTVEALLARLSEAQR